MSSVIEYVSVIVLNSKTDEIAMLKKLKGPKNVVGRFTVPGGKVESGETIQEAARREFLEEAGVDLSILSEDRLKHVYMAAGNGYRVNMFLADTELTGMVRAQDAELEKVFVGSIKKFITSSSSMRDVVGIIKRYLKENGHA